MIWLKLKLGIKLNKLDKWYIKYKLKKKNRARAVKIGKYGVYIFYKNSYQYIKFKELRLSR